MTFPKPPADTRGTLVEHLPVHAVTFDLGSTPPAELSRIYVGLPGSATASAFSQPFVIGVCFQVTAPGCSLVGYSPWCCNSGQDASPAPCALWQLIAPGAGVLVAGGTVTTGPLTLGAYNDTFLPAPVPLVAGDAYVAQVGYASGFALYTNFWNSSGVGYDGIVNGPLVAFSDTTASRPTPFSQPQQSFSQNVLDPTLALTLSGNSSFTSFLDVLVSAG